MIVFVETKKYNDVLNHLTTWPVSDDEDINQYIENISYSIDDIYHTFIDHYKPTIREIIDRIAFIRFPHKWVNNCVILYHYPLYHILFRYISDFLVDKLSEEQRNSLYIPILARIEPKFRELLITEVKVDTTKHDWPIQMTSDLLQKIYDINAIKYEKPCDETPFVLNTNVDISALLVEIIFAKPGKNYIFRKKILVGTNVFYTDEYISVGELPFIFVQRKRVSEDILKQEQITVTRDALITNAKRIVSVLPS